MTEINWLTEKDRTWRSKQTVKFGNSCLLHTKLHYVSFSLEQKLKTQIFKKSNTIPWEDGWIDERKQGEDDPKWLQYTYEIWPVVSNLATLLILDKAAQS